MERSNPQPPLMTAPHRFLFDEDCGICTKFALVLQNHARRPVELVPMHSVPAETGARSDLGEDEYWASAHFVHSDGREFHGGASVTRAMRLLPGGFLVAVLDAPVMRILRNRVYVIVARNRHHISRVLGLGSCRL